MQIYEIYYIKPNNTKIKNVFYFKYPIMCIL